jgi:hypothetical protein
MDKILVDKSVLEQALEALTTPIHEQRFGLKQDAIVGLSDALAQQEQEPVAWLRRDELADLQTCNYRRLGADSPRIWAPHQSDSPDPALDLVAVYTTPPRREWQGLTDTDIARVFRAVYGGTRFGPSEKEFAIAVEAKLKEKNNR